MNNLKKYAFADLYDMASGISSTKDQAGHGAPFVSFSTVFNNYFLPDELPDLMDTSEKEQEIYSIKEGDILITRTSETIDELAMSCVATKDYPKATYSGFTKRLRPKTEGIAYSKYLAFYLRGYLFRKAVTNNAFMTLRASFNEDIFSFLNLHLPDYEQQVKIGDLFYLIEQKIQLNKKINDNLEQQAQLLFKSWFVDFEPFNGTMPSDWEVVPFEKIVDFQNGYAFKSKELLNEPSSDCYQVFKQGHIARGGGFIPDGTKSWYPKKLASKLERFVLKKGDILMAMTDMKDNVAILGNTAIMPIDNEYIVNQRVGHLRVNGYKGITYPFIYLLTNNTDFLIDLRSRANSGVQVNLSSAEIKASQTVLPSEKVNTAFSEITLPMFEAIISNQLENQRLAQLRDALLPKLMSGELDVSNIDL